MEGPGAMGTVETGESGPSTGSAPVARRLEGAVGEEARCNGGPNA